MKVIAAKLGVSVSSVSLWTRDILLSPAQLKRLEDANPIFNPRLRGRHRRRETCRQVRLTAQEHGREMARQGDPLHQQGCMLYWAEGTKSRNSAKLTNSDPDLLVVFRRFLTQCFSVERERLCLNVNCFLNNGLSLAEIEAWWLSRLGLSVTCLRGAAINRPSRASRARRNTLLYGTACVSLNSTFVVQSIFGAIQEYGGFERPDWLDCEPRSRHQEADAVSSRP